MAEQLVNEFTVNRPIEEAWTVLTDVERIAPCLPGAQLQEIAQDDAAGSDVYRGIVKVKLGSITPQFKGQASFLDRDDAAHRAVLKAEGRDTGGRGNASAEITARAESLSPTSTKVTVTTDLHITGKVAQFGRGIIGDVSKKLMEQFAGNLNTMLDDQGLDDQGLDDQGLDDQGPDDQGLDDEGVDRPALDGHALDDQSRGGDAPTEPPASSGATGSVTSPGADPAAPDSSTGTPASGPETAPRVRKIDSPATEPVDLAGVAGPAILKRVAPVLGAIVVLLLVLRRRR